MIILLVDLTCLNEHVIIMAHVIQVFLQSIKTSRPTCTLTLTLSWVWWGRCEKNYLPKEEGREGGEKKRAQRARRARGSNPGPAAC